jgi:orotidine-5'-phosphate decarboxylase
MSLPEPIIALDHPNKNKVYEVLTTCNKLATYCKIGPIPLLNYSTTFISEAQALGWNVFLDLKIYETPSTTIQVLDWASQNKISLMTVCYTPDTKITIKHKRFTKILAVKTLTTSTMIEEDSFKNWVKKIRNANFDGVVCPAMAALWAREVFPDAIVVSPGARLNKTSDHTFTYDPKDAVQYEIDYLVIGRPIMNAVSPKETLKKFIDRLY